MLAKAFKQYCSQFTPLYTAKAFSTSSAHLFHRYQHCTQKDQVKPTNLIVLHGVLGSSKNFRGITQNPKISSQVDTYLLDMRNHGKSEHKDSMTYAEMAEDVHDWIVENRLEYTPNILMGHSMGARVAMEVSVRYPHLVQGTIAIDLAPYNYYDDENFGFIDAMDDMLQKLIKIDLSKDIKQIKKEIMYAAMNKEVGEVVATNLVLDDNGKHVWKINMASIAKNFRNQVLHTEYLGNDKFYGDALVILGAKSEYTSPEVVPSFRKVFPNLDTHDDVVFISDAGHWVHYSDPHGFINVVSQFIKKSIAQKQANKKQAMDSETETHTGGHFLLPNLHGMIY